jgi:MFS family permease
MPQFMGGRFLLGFGVSYCCIAAPTYVSELAHPKVSNKIMTMRKVTNDRVVERYSYGLLQLYVVCTRE